MKRELREKKTIVKTSRHTSITAAILEEIRTKIKDNAKVVRKYTRQKDEYFSEKVKTQKKVDLLIQRETVMKTQVTSYERIVTEQKTVIESIEKK